MTTYKQIVRLDTYEVQYLCISRDWYTSGNSEEYMALMDKVRVLELLDGDSWVAQLQDIAEDIKYHSDTDYEVEDIMTALGMKCRRWFEEA